MPALDRNWQTAWKHSLGVDSRCDDTHETEYTEASLRAELAEAGLEVRELVARWGEYWVVAEGERRRDEETKRRSGGNGNAAASVGDRPASRTPHYSIEGEYTDRESKAVYIGRKYASVLGGSVLDVGCGAGLLRGHVRRPELYTGVDFAGLADVTIDLERGVLPFADRSFDTVVATDVLEHLEAAHAMFDECCRVARSRVIISLPNPARNFLTEVFAGSGGRMKYYGLPPENPGDRHRWFFGFEEAEAFVRAGAARNGLGVEQLDSSHDGCCYWLNGKGEDVLGSPNFKRGTLWAVLRRDGN
ncbi:MAG: methyltransferase domain-containing protein [Phycisphaerales bacterium]|nr:methyltransferase domain-containing protein [Phycisphaerales bacterium]